MKLKTDLWYERSLILDALISVIVPVYNVEKYLPKCYDSISMQTYSNLEIIFVDDGSKDNSGRLCDEIREKDTRVRVIHKENGGLGFARNSGLEVANGQFVMFIDSDDYIQHDMVQKLYDRIVEFGADTSFCGFSVFFEEGKSKKREPYYKNNIFKDVDIIDKVLLEMVAGLPEAKVDAIIPMSSCCALYSMEVIRKMNLRFLSERQFISEDILFNIDYLRYAKCVSYIGDTLYNYRYSNMDSLTHKFDLNDFEKQKKQYLKLNQKLSNFLQPEKYDLRTKRYFLGRVRVCVNKAFTYAKKNSEFKLLRYVREILNDELVCEVIRHYPYKKNPIKVRLFNMCIRYKFCGGAILLMMVSKMRRNNRF